MPIIRCKDQEIKTVNEFYSEIEKEKESSQIGFKMLLLINQLNLIFRTTEIYGLTSLYRLILLSENKSIATRNVIIASDGNKYYVDYLKNGKTEIDIHNSLSAKEVDDAVKLVIEAMKKSNGWIGNNELN